MKWFWRVFDFYINSSIHVSLAVVSLLLISIWEFNIDWSWNLIGYVFFGSITGYNFVKYAKIAGMHHRSLAKSLNTIQVFSLISFLLCLYFLFKMSFQTVLSTFLFGVLTIFYVLPFGRSKNLRKLSGAKVFVVAIVWAGITVMVPWFSNFNEILTDTWLSFIQRIGLVLVLILPFEIRDLPFDSTSLKTIPQLIGVDATKVAGTLLIMFCLVLELFKDDFSAVHLISFGIVGLILIFLLWVSQKKQSKYFSSFLVESIPIVWVLIFLFLEELFR